MLQPPQLRRNGFAIVDDEWVACGVGLYLQASRLNHSCVPNCAVVFSGRKILVHTLRPCVAGEEVMLPARNVWAARCQR